MKHGKVILSLDANVARDYGHHDRTVTIPVFGDPEPLARAIKDGKFIVFYERTVTTEVVENEQVR